MKQTMYSWCLLILLLTLLLLFFIFHLDTYLTFSALREHHGLLLAWTKTHHIASALIFSGCYTLVVAVSIPGALFFTLVGGFLFGIFWGTVLVVGSATLGATIIFFVVRSSVGSVLAQSATSWLESMRDKFKDNAFSYLLVLRLVPLFPFWVVNIVPALLNMNGTLYVIATFLGIIPGSFVYVLVGNGLSQVFKANQTSNLSIMFDNQVLFPLLGLALLSLLPLFYNRLKRQSSKANSSSLTCDIAIIGAGAGGLSVAAIAAQIGLKVILIESGKMGGDCLNYGCIPSKALLASAKMAYQARYHANTLGIGITGITIDFKKVMCHVHNTIQRIEKNDSIQRFQSLGVRVIQATAYFLDSKTLMAGNDTIQAKHIVIATGSSPYIPSIPGLDNISYLTNETIFDLTQQPKHLIVMGGGAIGCELAQAFAMLGSEVTIIERESLLFKGDIDGVNLFSDQLKTLGVAVYEQSNIEHVAYDQDNRINVIVQCQEKHITITGSHLLIATGRRPNIAGLDLDKANIRYSNKGITVNNRLQTNHPSIYALGDVVGSYPFTHVASYHAGIVLRNIVFKFPAKVDYRAVPWVTYTQPEIAQVGLLAKQALTQSNLQITEWLFSDNDRAQTDQTPMGKIKVITNKKGTILGVTIIGEHAGELILPWVIAIREKKTLRRFTDAIVPYPTLSEVSKRVAGEFYTSKLFSNKTRWLVGLLKKLG